MLRERDLLTRAAEAYGTGAERFRKLVDELRKTAGPPWSVDQKTAAAAALLALRGSD
jgi:hypothetical protein